MANTTFYLDYHTVTVKTPAGFRVECVGSRYDGYEITVKPKVKKGKRPTERTERT